MLKILFTCLFPAYWYGSIFHTAQEGLKTRTSVKNPTTVLMLPEGIKTQGKTVSSIKMQAKFRSWEKHFSEHCVNQFKEKKVIFNEL